MQSKRVARVLRAYGRRRRRYAAVGGFSFVCASLVMVCFVVALGEFVYVYFYHSECTLCALCVSCICKRAVGFDAIIVVLYDVCSLLV